MAGGRIRRGTCDNPGVDLTAVATPGYFASMGIEHKLLQKRAERIGPTAADYERDDTLANLTMGTASLLIPMATHALFDRIAPQRSKTGKGLIAVAATAAVATTVADRIIRRRAARRRSATGRASGSSTTADLSAGSAGGTVAGDALPSAGTNGHTSTNGHGPPAVDLVDPVLARPRLVARYGGPTAIVAGGIALTSAVGSATRPKRLWASPRRTRDLGTGALAALGTIAAWDFIYYWNHRLMHEARYLWAIHVVHHSSERYNLSTALRQPVADSLGTFVPYGALCLAGIRPALIEQARGVNLLYQFWIHTDIIPKLGRFEEGFNTASHHRVHHGRNPRYIDRNHGSILIVWDRLFGTFQREEEDEPVVYGLTRNIRTDNPVTIATHEYKDILRDVADSDNWADRLSFVIRGPGWAYARRAEMDADPTQPSPRPAAAGVA